MGRAVYCRLASLLLHQQGRTSRDNRSEILTFSVLPGKILPMTLRGTAASLVIRIAKLLAHALFISFILVDRTPLPLFHQCGLLSARESLCKLNLIA